jgi:hypothetical protein
MIGTLAFPNVGSFDPVLSEYCTEAQPTILRTRLNEWEFTYTLVFTSSDHLIACIIHVVPNYVLSLFKQFTTHFQANYF